MKYIQLALVLIGIGAFVLDLRSDIEEYRSEGGFIRTKTPEETLKDALPHTYQLLKVDHRGGTLQVWIQDEHPYQDAGSEGLAALAQVGNKMEYFLVVLGSALQALPGLADAAFAVPEVDTLKVDLQIDVVQVDAYGNSKQTPAVIAEFSMGRQLYEKANLGYLSQKCSKFLELLKQEGGVRLESTAEAAASSAGLYQLYAAYTSLGSVDPSRLSPEERAFLCWMST